MAENWFGQEVGAEVIDLIRETLNPGALIKIGSSVARGSKVNVTFDCFISAAQKPEPKKSDVEFGIAVLKHCTTTLQKRAPAKHKVLSPLRRHLREKVRNMNEAFIVVRLARQQGNAEVEGTMDISGY